MSLVALHELHLAEILLKLSVLRLHFLPLLLHLCDHKEIVLHHFYPCRRVLQINALLLASLQHFKLLGQLSDLSFQSLLVFLCSDLIIRRSVA